MAELRYFFDLGNTRLKLWACRGDELLLTQALVHGGQPAALLQGSVPEGFGVLPASVQGASVLDAAQNQAFAQRVQACWGREPAFAKVAAEHGGVRCAYEEPARLGIDRWLAVLAVAAEGQETLVVDCGTAITLDLISAQREHLGGFIVPGLDMMAEALSRRTRQITLRTRPQAALQPGRSTEQAVINGALLAALGAIERLSLQCAKERGARPELVLTGGGAKALLRHLPSDCRYEPELLLRGLQKYFNN